MTIRQFLLANGLGIAMFAALYLLGRSVSWQASIVASALVTVTGLSIVAGLTSRQWLTQYRRDLAQYRQNLEPKTRRPSR